MTGFDEVGSGSGNVNAGSALKTWALPTCGGGRRASAYRESGKLKSGLACRMRKFRYCQNLSETKQAKTRADRACACASYRARAEPSASNSDTRAPSMAIPTVSPIRTVVSAGALTLIRPSRSLRTNTLVLPPRYSATSTVPLSCRCRGRPRSGAPGGRRVGSARRRRRGTAHPGRRARACRRRRARKQARSSWGCR